MCRVKGGACSLLARLGLLSLETGKADDDGVDVLSVATIVPESLEFGFQGGLVLSHYGVTSTSTAMPVVAAAGAAPSRRMTELSAASQSLAPTRPQSLTMTWPPAEA